MSSASVKNVALIGLGMVAETHLRAVWDLKEKLHLACVCGQDEDRTNKFADKVADLCGHRPKVATAIDQLPANIDFAIVATPPNARSEIVEYLSANGIHILMEKPVERTSESAAKLVELCESRDISLGIVFQHRVRKSSRALSDLIASNVFGALGLAEVSVPWWREQAYYDEPGRGTYARDGGGVLISQAIHTLDLLLSLTGPVSSVTAMARTSRFHEMESEDFVTAGLEFENGAIGSLIASTASFPGDAESISLHFDKASVLLKAGTLEIKWRDGKTETIGEESATGGGADPMAFTHDWHRGIIEDFNDAIDENRAPLVTVREALKTHFLIDALIDSSKSKSSAKVAQLTDSSK